MVILGIQDSSTTSTAAYCIEGKRGLPSFDPGRDHPGYTFLGRATIGLAGAEDNTRMKRWWGFDVLWGGTVHLGL